MTHSLLLAGVWFGMLGFITTLISLKIKKLDEKKQGKDFSFLIFGTFSGTFFTYAGFCCFSAAGKINISIMYFTWIVICWWFGFAVILFCLTFKRLIREDKEAQRK